MATTIRVSVSLFVAVCAIGALTSCERTNIPPPISFTLRDGEPIVRLCVGMTVEEVRVEAYSARSSTPGTTRWEGLGPVVLQAGSELVLGASSEGLTGDPEGVDVLAEDLSVRLIVSKIDSGHWQTSDTIELQTPLGNEQFVEGVWIGGNAEVIKSAC